MTATMLRPLAERPAAVFDGSMTSHRSTSLAPRPSLLLVAPLSPVASAAFRAGSVPLSAHRIVATLLSLSVLLSCLALLLLLPLRPASAVALGGDDRQPVRHIKGTAFGPIGLMVLDEGQSDAVAGTAFLVSPCHVLTAYHVAGGGKEINAKTTASFYLGQGSIGPDFDDAQHFADQSAAHPVVWGKYVPSDDDGPAAQRARAMLENGWQDWALLKLDRCLGGPDYDYGYFQLAPITTRDLTRDGLGLRVSSVGLPGDKSMDRLWRDPDCRIVGQVHNSGWQHDCVTVPGNSGGPLLLAPEPYQPPAPPSEAEHGARPRVVAITIAITGVDGLDNAQSDELDLAKNDPNYYDLLGTAVPVSALIDKIQAYLPPDPTVSAFLAEHQSDEHYGVDQGQLAITDLNAAVARYPNRSELYILRAGWRDSLDQADQALADYREAVTVDPSYAPARYLYGRALLQRGDDNPGYLDQAAAAFTQVLDSFPRSPDVLLYRAFALRAMKRNDAAIADLTATLAVQPTSAVATNERGDAYRDQRRDDLALADYTRAIQLNGQWPEALRDRGYLYHRLARYDLARADFRRALVLDPTDAEAANGLALCDLSSGQVADAVKGFDRVIKMAPDVGVYYANRATARMIAGDAAAAVPDFQKAAQLDPDEPFNQLLLYLAEARSGATSAAREKLAAFAARWPAPAPQVDDAGANSTDAAESVATEAVENGVTANGSTGTDVSGKANTVKDAADHPQKLAGTHLATSGAAAASGREEWPRPVIDFFLGRIDRDQVAAAAAKGDAQLQADQRFDVDFYLGQWALLSGNKTEGGQRLQAVVKSGLREFMEFDIAKADLGLMGQ